MFFATESTMLAMTCLLVTLTGIMAAGDCPHSWDDKAREEQNFLYCHIPPFTRTDNKEYCLRLGAMHHVELGEQICLKPAIKRQKRQYGFSSGGVPPPGVAKMKKRNGFVDGGLPPPPPPTPPPSG